MKIGDAANRSGVSAKMIRYYEQIGLIPNASRSASGYREYELQEVHKLRFIARARDLGFSIAEISELLNLWGDKDRRSADVRTLVLARVRDLRGKIAHLQDMADTLEDLANACEGSDRPNCPILQQLETAAPGENTSSRRPHRKGFKERID